MTDPVAHLLAGPNGAGKSTLYDKVLGPATLLPFVNAETVFSHTSKVELVSRLVQVGYRVHLHGVIVPMELSVARVANRVDNGGHSVPVDKVRARFVRVWPLVAEAIGLAQEATVYDNSSAVRPHRIVAQFISGRSFGDVDWPWWAPPELVALTA